MKQIGDLSCVALCERKRYPAPPKIRRFRSPVARNLLYARVSSFFETRTEGKVSGDRHPMIKPFDSAQGRESVERQR